MAGCGLIRRFLPLRGSRFADLDPRLERRPGEQLILKKYASAFFGTHLASTLTSQGIDTYQVALRAAVYARRLWMQSNTASARLSPEKQLATG